MLSARSRLGPYEIRSLIGAGGMGEVYRAHDTRLGREVAIKVLPADRLTDEHRRRRFLQEAQSASALNHPHIVTIYEIETADGLDFIVMEYVRGKSVDELIPRAGMRLAELLLIAIPVADAVAAAHARGIVHRDLKPANVIVGHDRTVKVLDFGLAKLVGGEFTPDEETVTHLPDPGMSAPGTIAGTAAYMAPEQATGGRVDARSDIFSFGAMLYEMATGTRAFSGNSTADTLAAVVRAQPKPPSQIVAALPRELERLILRCLRKEPDRRFQTMLDVKIELQEIKEESDSGALAAPVTTASRWSRGGLGAGIVAVVAIVAAVVWFFSTDVGSRMVLRMFRGEARRVGTPGPFSPAPFTTFPGYETAPTFSPDGSQIAFAWSPDGPHDQFDLYVKVIGSEKPLRLTSHPSDFIFPAWSPDGRQIAFARMEPGDSGIYLVSPIGGPERKLTSTQFSYFLEAVFSWSPDGKRLAFYDIKNPRESGVFLLDVDTLERRWLGSPSAECSTSWVPIFSPDGLSLAVACRMTYGVNDLFVLPVAGGTGRSIARVQGDFTGMTWTADSASLIFGAEGDLWRIAASGGEREKLLAGHDTGMPAISRDGHRLAYTMQSAYTVNLWQVELPVPTRTAGPPVKLVASSKTQGRPAFSPDGRRLAFGSTRSGASEIWTSDADGSNATALTAFGGPWSGSPTWSPDGRSIAFDARDADRSSLYIVPSGGGQHRRVATGVAESESPSWSTDGGWLFFSGPRAIFKVAVDGGALTPLTKAGGDSPRASPFHPLRVYYSKDSGICSVAITGGPEQCLSGFPRLRPEFSDAWVLGSMGVYFINPEPPHPGIDFFEFASARSVRVIDLAGRAVPWGGWPALSPDGRRLLYPQLDTLASDIMLVDHLR